MPLAIRVQFLAGYSGREWPPSPARLFKALVSSARAGWSHSNRKAIDDSLRVLERQGWSEGTKPEILAPHAKWRPPRQRRFVPNNSKNWPTERKLNPEKGIDLEPEPMVGRGHRGPKHRLVLVAGRRRLARAHHPRCVTACFQPRQGAKTSLCSMPSMWNHRPTQCAGGQLRAASRWSCLRSGASTSATPPSLATSTNCPWLRRACEPYRTRRMLAVLTGRFPPSCWASGATASAARGMLACFGRSSVPCATSWTRSRR
jgi:hypothetical protein